jgi:HlyD family secretion protein
MAKPWRRTFIAILFGALLIAGLFYAFLPQPVWVDLGVVTRGTLHVTVDEEGKTRVKDVYVVSAPLTGRALRITKKVGDEVIAGETVLATIEETDPSFLDVRTKAQALAQVRAAEAAKKLAKAELERAQADREFARAELKRARELVKDKTISQSAFERTELEFKSREAAVGVAQAALRVKNFELESARASLIEPDMIEKQDKSPRCCVHVRAPVSGRVLRILHESEGVVEAGTPLIEIGDPKQLEVVVELLSTDAVKVKGGAEVVIEEWGGGPTLMGRVRRVEPYGFTKISALGIEEQRVNVIVDFTDPPERWRLLGHGYRVETRSLVWRGKNVLRVPVSALYREGDSWAVFVFTGDRAQERRVKIGQRNTLEAQVLDGLKPGERVVLHPSDQVNDGVRITPRPSE